MMNSGCYDISFDEVSDDDLDRSHSADTSNMADDVSFMDGMDAQPRRRKKGSSKKQKLLAGTPMETQTCVVCGDRASGYHYSALTCEACKSFFKRTVQDKHEYVCNGNFDCPVSKSMRKSCQLCRFQKCLRVGMLPQDVRLDRTRGGRKKCKRTSREAFDQLVVELSTPNMKPEEEDVDPKTPGNPLLSNQQQQRRNNNNNNDNSFFQVNIRANDVSNINNVSYTQFMAEIFLCDSIFPSITIDFDQEYPPKTFHTFSLAMMQWFHRGLMNVVTWANSFKCLNALSVEDRCDLICENWFGVLLIETAYLSLPYRSVIQFCKNFSLSDAEVKLYTPPTDFYSTLDGMFMAFNVLNPSRQELAILKFLTLLDHSTLHSDSLISNSEALRSLTVRVLQFACDDSHANVSSVNRRIHFSRLLLRQSFITNMKMGLECWKSIFVMTKDDIKNIVMENLLKGVKQEPLSCGVVDDDIDDPEMIDDVDNAHFYRSKIYFKTMRPSSSSSSLKTDKDQSDLSPMENFVNYDR